MTNHEKNTESGHTSQLWAGQKIDPEWAQALADFEPIVSELIGRTYANDSATLPAQENVLRAFESPLSRVRVVIVGQDPYPTPGDAVGLSFSVDAGSKIPRSLNNIYKELHDDLGYVPANNGDLSAWADQGVLLLNRVLTVPAGNAGGHRGKGWEEFTLAAISTLAKRDSPLVAILWGKDAEKLAPILKDHHIIASAHPSPLSARRGFFGSKPFSRANRFLTANGLDPVDWEVPSTKPPTQDDVLF